MAQKLVLFTAILFLTIPFALAETIKLKSGKTHEGKIVERTDKYIKVDIGVRVPVTYFLDEIESINSMVLSGTIKESSFPTTDSKENIYRSAKYGASITGPREWTKTIFEKTKAEVLVDIYEKMGAKYDLPEKILEDFLIDTGTPRDMLDKIKEAHKRRMFLVGYYNYPLYSTIEDIVASIELYAEDAKSAPDSKTVLDFVNKDILEAKQTITGFNIIEQPRYVNIGDWAAVRFMSESKPVNFYQRILTYYILNKGRLFMISFGAHSRYIFENNLPTFEQAISSFKIERKE